MPEQVDHLAPWTVEAAYQAANHTVLLAGINVLRRTVDAVRVLAVVPELDGANTLLLAVARGAAELTVVVPGPCNTSKLAWVQRYTPDVFCLHNFLSPAFFLRFVGYLVRSRQPDMVLGLAAPWFYHAAGALRALLGPEVLLAMVLREEAHQAVHALDHVNVAAFVGMEQAGQPTWAQAAAGRTLVVASADELVRAVACNASSYVASSPPGGLERSTELLGRFYVLEAHARRMADVARERAAAKAEAEVAEAAKQAQRQQSAPFSPARRATSVGPLQVQWPAVGLTLEYFELWIDDASQELGGVLAVSTGPQPVAQRLKWFLHVLDEDGHLLFGRDQALAGVSGTRGILASQWASDRTFLLPCRLSLRPGLMQRPVTLVGGWLYESDDGGAGQAVTCTNTPGFQPQRCHAPVWSQQATRVFLWQLAPGTSRAAPNLHPDGTRAVLADVVNASWPDTDLVLDSYTLQALAGPTLDLVLTWRLAGRRPSSDLQLQLYVQDLNTYDTVRLSHDTFFRDLAGRLSPLPDWPAGVPILTRVQAALPSTWQAPGAAARLQLVLELLQLPRAYPLVWLSVSAAPDAVGLVCASHTRAHPCLARRAGAPTTRLLLTRSLATLLDDDTQQ